MRILTLGDFYGRRYGRAVETLASLLCLTSFVILLASNLAGAGIVIHFIIGEVPATTIVLVVATLLMAYAIAGGLFAVTWNDVLHSGVSVIAFGALLVWLVVASPLPDAAAAFQAGFSWEPLHSRSEGALANWATLIALGLGDVVALDFMERVFAAKTPRHARVACLTAGVAVIAMGVGIATIGVLASSLAPGTDGADSFLAFLEASVPPGIRMVVFMGLIAACLSTADGVLMACSSVFTRNVVQRNFPSLIPSHRLLAFSRLCLVPLTVLACILAIARPDPGDLLVLAFEVVLAGCFVPLALGIYWKRAHASAAFWAILIPSVLRVVLYFVTPAEWAGLDTLLPPVVSLLIFVPLSLRATHA